MSLERTPPPPQNSAFGFSDAQCIVCKELMLETHECLIIMNCNHVFHKECIERHLSQSMECPECHKACELADLKKFHIHDNSRQNPGSKSNANVRGKGRGAMAKRYHTRNVTKNLFNENANSSLDFPQNNPQPEYVEDSQSFTPTRNMSNAQNSLNIDSSQLTQIIETS
ncbi:E3 ubiquitin-protein ligase RNF128-like, partial [Lucilia cuprina]|uniref:E3 ubiquitin-protein ligase RNF128-like n=1 Tax=Lucilia cuprina TaxID=7375 RepID=UPI001F068457